MTVGSMCLLEWCLKPLGGDPGSCQIPPSMDAMGEAQALMHVLKLMASGSTASAGIWERM